MGDRTKGQGAPWRDEETLREEYVHKQQSTHEVAEKLGCSASTVRRYMDKHDIPRRSASEANKLSACSHDSKTRNATQERPWKDEERLREEYAHKQQSTHEVAEKLGCSASTVRKYMDKYGIQRRSASEANKLSACSHDPETRNATQERPWKDEERLREEYVNKKRSTYELADEWGCSASTVRKYMDKHDIQRRDPSGGHPSYGHPSFRTRGSSNIGYEVMRHGSRGDRQLVMHHRLLAVAEWGLDAIRGKEVHHKNNIPWDNRVENLELLTKSEHSKLHSKQRRERRAKETVNGKPWFAEDNLRRLYHELEWSSNDIADKYDVQPSSVLGHMEKHGIERRSMSQAHRLRVQDSQQQTLDTFVSDD